MNTSVAQQTERTAAGPAVGALPSLCIVNYNGAGYLDATLAAATAQGDSFSEILVVDSASEDDSVGVVERFPAARLIRLPENRGPAVARNVALREAGSALVLLIDGDVTPAPGCAEKLAEALRERPEAVAAMPRVLYAGDRERIQYDGADPHFLGLMSLHNRDRPLNGSDRDVREIGSVVTACFMIDRSRIEIDEPFDESFFIYFEDHDFGVRMRSRGHSILSVPSATCYHREGTPGLSIREVGDYTPMRVFCLIRNRWQFILKNYSFRSLFLLAPVLVVYELAQLAAVVKKGWFTEWARALGWTLGHLGPILRKRREIQKSRKRPDGRLFTDGPIPFRDELITGALERGGRRTLEAIASIYWQKVGRLV